MELKILKQTKNVLFDREDVSFTLSNTGATPTRQEIKNIVSAKTGKKQETIAVINISSEFGKNQGHGLVHIYKSKEDLEAKEPKYIVKRNIAKPKKDTPEQSSAAPSEGSEGEKKPAEGAEEKKEEKHVTNVEAKE
jgi:ribosomal protein S24E